jgi:hypothetical protein
MMTVPAVSPLGLLGSAFVQDVNSSVRLVEHCGGVYVEVDFVLDGQGRAALRLLLSLLDDVGWRPVPEETDCAELTEDGCGSRIRVRFDEEWRIDGY